LEREDRRTLERDITIVRDFPDGGFFERVRSRVENVLRQQLPLDDGVALPSADRLLDEVFRIAEPEYVFRITPVKAVSTTGIDTGFGTVESRMFSRLARLDGTDAFLVFMVATLGLGPGTLSRGKSLSMQMLSDIVMNELLEAYADEMDWREWVSSAIGCGMRHTERFSPGYCDWRLEGQRVIFRALQSRNMRVELNDLCVMRPPKSISGIALIGKRIEHPVPCVFCPRECPMRREEYREEPG